MVSMGGMGSMVSVILQVACLLGMLLFSIGMLVGFWYDNEACYEKAYRWYMVGLISGFVVALVLWVAVLCHFVWHIF